MFKKPGVRIECPRDMGNASERKGGSERYDDGGDPEGRLGMRWAGVNELFARWVRPQRSRRGRYDGHGAG